MDLILTALTEHLKKRVEMRVGVCYTIRQLDEGIPFKPMGITGAYNMKALHKLLVGTILVALAAFGLTALTSSSNDPATTAVWGFTDKYCQNQDYKWFKNVGALIAADGKKTLKLRVRTKTRFGDITPTLRMWSRGSRAIGWNIER